MHLLLGFRLEPQLGQNSFGCETQISGLGCSSALLCGHCNCPIGPRVFSSPALLTSPFTSQGKLKAGGQLPTRLAGILCMSHRPVTSTLPSTAEPPSHLHAFSGAPQCFRCGLATMSTSTTLSPDSYWWDHWENYCPESQMLSSGFGVSQLLWVSLPDLCCLWEVPRVQGLLVSVMLPHTPP